MNEIPDDVMKAAEELYKSLMTTCERWSNEDAEEDIPAIARAIMAEMERCGNEVIWQPIETAPKDGRVVLLGYQDSRGWFAARSGLWFLVHKNHREKDWAWAWVCPSMSGLIDQRATHWAPINAPKITVDM